MKNSQKTNQLVLHCGNVTILTMSTTSLSLPASVHRSTARENQTIKLVARLPITLLWTNSLCLSSHLQDNPKYLAMNCRHQQFPVEFSQWRELFINTILSTFLRSRSIASNRQHFTVTYVQIFLTFLHIHMTREYTVLSYVYWRLQFNADYGLSRETQLGRITLALRGISYNNKARYYLLNFNCPCWEQNPIFRSCGLPITALAQPNKIKINI